jgi:hypothetical protein
MVAHILWGSDGPVVRERYAHLPEYRLFADLPHADLRSRVRELLESGRLEKTADGRLTTSENA